MPFVAPPATSVKGTLHFIPPNVSAFELARPQYDTKTVHTLIWVGGLMDTYLSVTYPAAISQALPPTWTLALACLSSSGMQFGIRSVAGDAKDLAAIVAYIRSPRPGGKIVLMGHSTGCQDCVEYARTQSDVDHIILQAPVSDRQAIEMFLPQAHLQEVNETATKWCRDRHGEDILPSRLTKPIFMQAPISARRWLDLASPGPYHEGADDMFSTDLSDDRLAKVFASKVDQASWLILHSGEDESIPQGVDKAAIIDKWTKIIEGRCSGRVAKLSGVVSGASHNLNGDPEEVVQNLIERVITYLVAIETA